MPAAFRQILIIAFTTVYLLGQVVLVHAAETNLWAEHRRSASQKSPALLAQLPAGMSPLTNALRQVPVDASRVSRVAVEPALPPMERISTRLRGIVAALPAANVRVAETWSPPDATGDPIVVMQDVHLNGEAQSNLAVALETMMARGSLRFVGVEGAFGHFNFSSLRAFPDRPEGRALLERLLQAGEIAAPSFVGITTAVSGVAFEGVDDETPYLANVAAYLAADSRKDAVRKELAELRSAWRNEKSAQMSPALVSYAQARAGFHSGAVSLLTYAQALERYRVTAGPEIARYLQACRLEVSLDWNRVERERGAALAALTARLRPAEINELTTEALAFRDGRETLGTFYRRLAGRFPASGVSLGKFPAFASYLTYALLADGVKPEAVLAGLGAWEAGIVDHLSPTPAERRWLAMDAHLSLVEKISTFTLRPDEWDRYRDDGVTIPLASLAPFEAFYREADRRTEIMVAKMLRAPAGAKAVVVGGFHSPAIRAKLMAARVPFVIVTPRVTKIDAGGATAYLSIFSREKESLTRLFAGRQLFLSPAMIVDVGTDHPLARKQTLKVKALRAAVEKKTSGKNPAGYVVTEKSGGFFRVDSKEGALEVNPETLASRPALTDRARFVIRWIASLIETPVLTMAYGVLFSVLQGTLGPQLAPTAAFFIVVAAFTVAHAVYHRDWSPASLLRWSVGGLLLAAPLALWPGAGGMLTSAVLHIGWNEAYLRGIPFFSVPLSVIKVDSLDVTRIASELASAKRGLVFTDSPDAFDVALYDEARKRFPEKNGRVPYLRVTLRDESDLVRLRRTFIARDDGSFEKRDGPLMDIVQNGGLLFIDYAESDPKLVDGLNSLLDKKPYYEQRDASPDLLIVGAIGARVKDRNGVDVGPAVKKYPISFYSRFREKLTVTGVAEDVVDTLSTEEGPPDAVSIDLFESKAVRELLFGRYRLDNDGGVRFKPSRFKEALASGVLVLRGGDWSDPVLRNLVRQLIVQKSVEINGDTIAVPPDLRIYRPAGHYDGRNTIGKRLVAPREIETESPAFVINDETQSLLFGIPTTTNEGAFAEAPGLLSRGPVRLRVTESLPMATWNQILYADHDLVVEVSPGVSIPARYASLRSDALKKSIPAIEPTAWNDLKERRAVFVRSADPDHALEEIRAAFPGQTATVVPVTPGSSYADLVSGIDVKTVDGKRRFGAMEGPVLRALRDGKLVVLQEGDANPALLKKFQSAFMEGGYLPTYEVGQDSMDGVGPAGWVKVSDLPGRLVAIARSTNGAAPGAPFADLSPDDAAMAAALARRFGARFARADFDKILALRTAFATAPENLSENRPHFSFSRLALLFEHKGDWLTAFQRVFINEYSDQPEVAAFMRTMVRVTFGVDHAGLERNEVARSAVTLALDNMHAGLSLKDVSWQLADAAGIGLLLAKGPEGVARDFSVVPRDVAALVGQALAKNSSPERAAYYRTLFGLGTTVPTVIPELNARARVGLQDLEERALEVKEVLSRFNAVFLRGPPGTSKSYTAAAIAKTFDRAIGPITVGPDVTEADLVVKRKFDGKKITIEEGKVGEWVRTGGLLIIDEANLMSENFWNFLASKVDSRHKVIFTGNQESVAGRSAQKFIRDHVITIPFGDFDDRFLRNEVARIVAPTTKKRKDELVALLFDLFALYRKMGIGKAFTVRDVHELAARAILLTDNGWASEDVIGLSWRLLGGLFSPTEGEALRLLISRKFGVDVKVATEKKRGAVQERYAAMFEDAGMTPVPAFVDMVSALDEFREMREKRLKGLSREQGKRGLIIEGPSGRGKDDFLETFFEKAAGVSRNGAGTKRLYRLTASLNFDELVDTIRKAQREGAVMLVSELNLLPSAFIEGKLNDVLTGEAAEGFAFIATINASEFNGREKLSSALQNRVAYRVEADYSQAELQAIAADMARRAGKTDALTSEALNHIVNAHAWIREQIGDARYTPTTRELIGAVDRMLAGGAVDDHIRAVYGTVFLDQLLGGRSLPPLKELSSFQEKSPVDPLGAVSVIGRVLINRPDAPFSLNVDGSDPLRGGAYYLSEENSVSMRAAELRQPHGDWFRVFLHEISHGLFTRHLDGMGTFSGYDPMDPLYQDLEDVRHQRAFERSFPHSHLNPTSEMEADLLTHLFSPRDLLRWMAKMSPRQLFQYAIVATAKNLIDDETLRAAAGLMEGLIPGDPLSVVLRHAKAAREIGASIPTSLSEDEIRFRQHRALALMWEMRDDFLDLNETYEQQQHEVSDDLQQRAVEEGLRAARAAPSDLSIETPPGPPAVGRISDEEIARRKADVARLRVDARGAEIRELLGELNSMERDLRSGSASAERLLEMERQLTDRAHVATMVGRLQRADAATQRRAARLLKEIQAAKSGKAVRTGLFSGTASGFVARYRTWLLGAAALAVTAYFTVLLARYGWMLEIDWTRLDIARVLHALGFTAVVAALVYAAARHIFFPREGQVGGPSDAVKPKYGRAAIHTAAPPVSTKRVPIDIGRAPLPETWKPKEKTRTSSLSATISADLNDALGDFVGIRLQANRVYGLEGTPEPERFLEDPMTGFVRTGGADEQVKRQVVVIKSPGQADLTEILKATLDFLTEKGFSVRVIEATADRTAIAAELERLGPVDVVTAKALQANVEGLYVYGALRDILDRRATRPMQEPVSGPGLDEFIENWLIGIGVDDVDVRRDAYRITGSGLLRRVTLSLGGIPVMDISGLAPLGAALTEMDLVGTGITDVGDLSVFPNLRRILLPDKTTKPETIESIFRQHPSARSLLLYLGEKLEEFYISQQSPYTTLGPDAKKFWLESFITNGARINLREGEIRCALNFINLRRLALVPEIRRVVSSLHGDEKLRGLAGVRGLEYLDLDGPVSEDEIRWLLNNHPNRGQLVIRHKQYINFGSDDVIFKLDQRKRVQRISGNAQFEETKRIFNEPETPDAVNFKDGEISVIARTDELPKMGDWPFLTSLQVENDLADLQPLRHLTSLKYLFVKGVFGNPRQLIEIPSLEEVSLQNNVLDEDEVFKIVAQHPNPHFSLTIGTRAPVTKAVTPLRYREAPYSDPYRALTRAEQMDEARRLAWEAGDVKSNPREAEGSLALMWRRGSLSGFERLVDLEELAILSPGTDLSPLAGLPKLRLLSIPAYEPGMDFSRLRHLEELEITRLGNFDRSDAARILVGHPNPAFVVKHGGHAYRLDDLSPEIRDAEMRRRATADPAVPSAPASAGGTSPAQRRFLREDYAYLKKLFSQMVDGEAAWAFAAGRLNDDGRSDEFEAIKKEFEKIAALGAPAPTVGRSESLPKNSAIAVRSGVDRLPEARAAVKAMLPGQQIADILGGRLRADMRLREFTGSPAGHAFSNALKETDFNATGFPDALRQARMERSGERDADERAVFDDVLSVVRANTSPVDLVDAVAANGPNKGPLVFVMRGREDETRARAAMAAARGREVLLLRAEEISSGGRVSLRMLDDRMKALGRRNGVTDAFVLLPEGLPFDADLDAEILRSLVIATLDEVFQTRVLSGRAVENALRAARLIAINA